MLNLFVKNIYQGGGEMWMIPKGPDGAKPSGLSFADDAFHVPSVWSSRSLWSRQVWFQSKDQNLHSIMADSSS